MIDNKTAFLNIPLPNEANRMKSEDLPRIIQAFELIDALINSKAALTDVTAVVNDILGGAPEALNTLKELADAINDDANFAASVTTALSNKANTSSLSAIATSGEWADILNKVIASSGTLGLIRIGQSLQVNAGTGVVDVVGLLSRSGDTLTGALNFAADVTIASDSTTNIATAASNNIIITGTSAITALGTVAAGAIRKVTFSGALVLTHNATSLILPTESNIATAAGDTAEFKSLGGGNWVCTGYLRKNGTALSVSLKSITTGDVVAAGNLLAIDDSGNSLAVDSITTGIVQAVTAVSLHACALTGGNTAIFWTISGSTDLRMMVVDSTGATVLASTSVGTGLSNTPIWSAQLTNGNIVFCYKAITTQYPTFKIIDTSGVEVVAATTIESAAANSDVKVCALTGGGFATTYCGASSYPKLAVYTNTGSVTTAVTTIFGGGHSRVSICPRPNGGFATLYGGATMTGMVYNSVGTPTSGIAFNIDANGEVGLASTTGSVVAANAGSFEDFTPSIALSSDTTSLVLNAIDGGVSTSTLAVQFDVAINRSSNLRVTTVTVLGDGSYLAIYTAFTTSREYPRFVNFWGDGTVIRSGYIFNESTYASDGYAMYAMPVGENGFSLVWLAPNRNIKFAHVKSGKVVGISAGQSGGYTRYEETGEATVTSNNMLNVGGAKVNYSRQNNKVIV